MKRPNSSDGLRTGQVGNVYEYYVHGGRRLPGTNEETITQMIQRSAGVRDTYSQYVGSNGYVTWAYMGAEIDNPFPPIGKDYTPFLPFPK